MGRLFGITGTPGTGKKSISPLVAEKLRVSCVSLSALAASKGIVEGSEGEVETASLAALVAREIAPPSLVYGHLLPYVLEKSSVARVVVLRCEPSVLRSRLEARGYPPRKVRQNVEAELIGLVAADTHLRFGRSKVAEYDTSGKDPRRGAASVAKMLAGDLGRSTQIDWAEGYLSASRLNSLFEGLAPSALT